MYASVKTARLTAAQINAFDELNRSQLALAVDIAWDYYHAQRNQEILIHCLILH